MHAVFEGVTLTQHGGNGWSTQNIREIGSNGDTEKMQDYSQFTFSFLIYF